MSQPEGAAWGGRGVAGASGPAPERGGLVVAGFMPESASRANSSALRPWEKTPASVPKAMRTPREMALRSMTP